MKHGDKEKGKASKASKTSGKKASQTGGKAKAVESKGREAGSQAKTDRKSVV